MLSDGTASVAFHLCDTFAVNTPMALCVSRDFMFATPLMFYPITILVSVFLSLPETRLVTRFSKTSSPNLDYMLNFVFYLCKVLIVAAVVHLFIDYFRSLVISYFCAVCLELKQTLVQHNSLYAYADRLIITEMPSVYSKMKHPGILSADAASDKRFLSENQNITFKREFKAQNVTVADTNEHDLYNICSPISTTIDCPFVHNMVNDANGVSPGHDTNRSSITAQFCVQLSHLQGPFSLASRAIASSTPLSHLIGRDLLASDTTHLTHHAELVRVIKRCMVHQAHVREALRGGPSCASNLHSALLETSDGLKFNKDAKSVAQRFHSIVPHKLVSLHAAAIYSLIGLADSVARKWNGLPTYRNQNPAASAPGYYPFTCRYVMESNKATFGKSLYEWLVIHNQLDTDGASIYESQFRIYDSNIPQTLVDEDREEEYTETAEEQHQQHRSVMSYVWNSGNIQKDVSQAVHRSLATTAYFLEQWLCRHAAKKSDIPAFINKILK